MVRVVCLALTLLALGSAPGFAQSNSELAGAPGYLAEQDAAKRDAARKKVADEIEQVRRQTRLNADKAARAKQPGAQTSEEARLAKQAEELKALEAQLDARAAELDAEEARLAGLRAELEAQPAIRDPGETAPFDRRDERPGAMRFEASVRSCARAGEDAALSRDFYSAHYDSPPRFYERRSANDGRWELRGVMRVEDRRGWLLADTVCELDARGQAEYFAFVR